MKGPLDEMARLQFCMNTRTELFFSHHILRLKREPANKTFLPSNTKILKILIRLKNAQNNYENFKPSIHNAVTVQGRLSQNDMFFFRAFWLY